jgi:hypothetical protein
MIQQDLIPQEKTAAVTQGLCEAFGVTEFEDIRKITKGQTPALIFRIVVKGRPYLLRLIMYKNSILGPERHFTCMRLASEAGLAPRVRYTSIEDQLSITDFVEEVPFPAAEALVRMPVVLRALHSLPPFAEVVPYMDTTCMYLMHKGAAQDGFFQKLREAHILSPAQYDDLFDWLAQVAAVYPRHEPDMVSSHNDLFKPDNILFDGNSVWLVDWEAAFRNDRYVDLAVVANMLVTNQAEESRYLQSYFGQPPDEYQLARFFLMQQIVHMFYASVFLLISQPLDQSEPAHKFTAFQRRFWTGEINLTEKATKNVYGRIHWERLVHNMRQPRLKEALRIVG